MDAAAVPPDVVIDPDDDATIFYTSGTTGRPKGAVGTHRNMCTNLMSLFFLTTRGQLRFGASPTGPVGTRQLTYLLSVPLFHATGCHAVMVGSTGAGGKIVMMHHFDPDRALELIERERVTTFGGVPAMVMQVLDSPDFAKTTPRPSARLLRRRARPPRTWCGASGGTSRSASPANGYGLTETSAVTSMNTGRRLRGQARQRRATGAGDRRRHRARGVRGRGARPTELPRAPRCAANCG